MKKMHIEYELTDSSTGTVRVLAADKIAFESFARAHGQPVEDGPRAVAYMLFAALRRTHILAEETSFDEFIFQTLADMAVTNADESEGEGEENPTR